jgi:hypothetical protein
MITNNVYARYKMVLIIMQISKYVSVEVVIITKMK